jgi:2-polyprenyl-3-methyl-5-hydroxy-6-metoxy-1,4-benzoquinol methylase
MFSTQKYSSRPAVVPVCPSCNGELILGRSASCAACGLDYPFLDQAIDFIQEEMGDHKDQQRAIYEGEEEAGIRLSYLDRTEHRNTLERALDNIAVYGLPDLSMRDAMNEAVFQRAGFFPGMEVLDIGSGNGLLLNTLASRFGTRGTGIDLSSIAVERSLGHNPHHLAFHRADAEKLPFPDASFDRVISFDVIEHISNQRQALAEAGRVVRPGGKIVFYAISLAEEHTWHWTQRQVSGGLAGTHEGAGHKPELFLRPDTVRGWLVELGFHSIEIVPFHSFFTLILDERLMELTRSLGSRPYIFRLIFLLSRLADLPWTASGLSNGFFFLAEKGEVQNDTPQ